MTSGSDGNWSSQASSVKWLKTVRMTLTVGLIAILLILILQQSVRDQIIDSIQSLSHLHIALLAALFVLMRVVQALSLRRVLSLYNQNIEFNSALSLAGLKGGFNLGFSGLGLVAQSAQARVQFLVPVRVMLFANVTQSFMLILALGVCLFLATLFFFEADGLPAPIAFLALALGAGLLGFSGAVICLLPNGPGKKVRKVKALRSLLPPEASRKPPWHVVVGIVVLQSALVVLRTARVLVIAYAITSAVNVEFLTVTVLAADTLGVIPITPGGIGVRELIIGMLGATTDHYEVYLAAAIIDRVLTVVFNIVHGSIAIWASGGQQHTAQ